MRNFARANHRSLRGPVVLAYPQAQSFASFRVIIPLKIVAIERRNLDVQRPGSLRDVLAVMSCIIILAREDKAPGRTPGWRNTSPKSIFCLGLQTPIHRSYRRGRCAFPPRPKLPDTK